jgi:glutathione S-transferase
MTQMLDLLSYENPVLSAYLFWSAILILKVLAMAILTGRQRQAKNVMANPEDIRFLKNPSKDIQAIIGDPDVERVRR